VTPETLTTPVLDEVAMLALAARWAVPLRKGAVVYLLGDLGAGKTTLARGIITALGHPGPVKSPTYTLVETYPLAPVTVCHLDLYRLGDPEELEFLGLRDHLDGGVLVLVEWPQRGAGALPPADLEITLQPCPGGRQLSVVAGTPHGWQLLREMQA